MSDNTNKDTEQKQQKIEKSTSGKSRKTEESSFKMKLNDFCDRLRDDKPFMTKVSIGVVSVLLLVVIVIAVATGNKRADGSTDGQAVSDNQAVGDEQVADTGDAEQDGTVSTDGSIEEEAGVSDNQSTASPTEQVNILIENYFNAMASGDTEAISSMKTGLEQEEALKIQKKSNYIENFENLNVLSKDGPVANSYVAFVYYEIKFKDIQTLAPGLTTLYLCTNESGSLQINDGELAEDVTEFIKNIAASEDVKAIFERVEVKYNEATDADPQLKSFMESLPKTLEQEVAQALNELKAQETPQENTEETPVDDTPAQAVTETVKTTDTVNVRSSDSETADKLGKVEAGTTLTRYETKENGWSRIDYEGKEAYIKTEFLTVLANETAGGNETQSENQNGADAAQNEVETVEGKIVVLETVNVRKSANENSDRIGTAYQGEYYELIMEQADGWTKIKFNGQVGYVKSEYVKK